ncbi:MAG: hypothetical protein QXR09_01995 [Candidatus Aenigmatarchaeota archaeon]
MFCPLKEACGVFGCSSSEDVARKIYYGLVTLQHRGQESVGISNIGRFKNSCEKSDGACD